VSAAHPAAGVWPVGDRLTPALPRRRFLLLVLLLLDSFVFLPPLNLSLIIPNTGATSRKKTKANFTAAVFLIS
jgi:hypothetical protein